MLVGDPQQLPATVKSQVAAALKLERSLFERIQAAAPSCIHLLSVQYRMHPTIRPFPSHVRPKPWIGVNPPVPHSGAPQTLDPNAPAGAL